MELKKNDEIELTIESLTAEGNGIGRYEGMVVFVNGAVPGDLLLVHIIKVTSSYAIGKAVNILAPSPNRIKPDCPVSGSCGGCTLRCMTYESELNYKLQRVKDAVQRIGKIDIEPSGIVGADSIYRYRNKAMYRVTKTPEGKAAFGFYAFHSHRIIPCSDCAILPEEFNTICKAFEYWIDFGNVSIYDENTNKGFFRGVYLRKAFATGEIMVCIIANGKSLPYSEIILGALINEVPAITSIVINVNMQKTNVVLGSRTRVLYGKTHITDELCQKKFIISPLSFYQINHDQCEKLYTLVKQYARLTGSETLVDLYCGTGTIGLTLADSVKELYGIEVVPSAIEDANKNAELNGITNAKFICADAFEGVERLKKKRIRPDVVILDPPRKGCTPELIKAVHKMNPKRIVYVSCDCATLARDLDLFKKESFYTKEITALDMFPRTAHVEAVARLERE